MKRLVWIVMLSLGLAARGAGAADAPVGQWQTVDEKSGAVEYLVQSFGLPWSSVGLVRFAIKAMPKFEYAK